jgi:hypothetical protein
MPDAFGTEFVIDLVTALPDANVDSTNFDQSQTINWHNYFIRYRYTRDRNVLQLPTASPAGSGVGICSIVQYADPYRTVEVEWTAKSSIGVPPIPNPHHLDNNLVLVKETVNPRAWELAADGTTPVWLISGMYRYAVIDPSKTIFQTGFFPFISSQEQGNALLPASVFQHGIIDTFFSPGSAGYPQDITAG